MAKAKAPERSAWRNSIVRYGEEPPEQLLAHPLNPKIHPKQQQDALAGAISEVGWIAPVIVNEVTQHVIDGHARIGIAISRGEPSVPVAYVNLTEEAERLALATFDPIGSLAAMDDANLAALLDGLTSADDAVSSLLRDLAPPVPKPLNPDDADLTPPPEPITKPGDLWLLGEHRLLCGDSTNLTDVARLMNGRKADMVFTDPPWGVDYDGGSGNDTKRERLANDDHDIYGEVLPLLDNCTSPTAPLYLWYAGWSPKPVSDALDASNWEVRALLIWNKLSPHYGAYMAQYMQRHEPFFYAHKAGQAPQWFGPTNEVTVWDVEQPSRNEHHPTQKPVALPARAMTNSSRRGDVVLDLFSGSGSTLIAAEQTDRIAYLMEIDPGYCDVAVRRWETVTGKKAERVGQADKANA